MITHLCLSLLVLPNHFVRVQIRRLCLPAAVSTPLFENKVLLYAIIIINNNNNNQFTHASSLFTYPYKQLDQ